MSTKLQAMVGLLAGREPEPALLEELADPTSEASRFLESTRARSRALFAGPVAAAPPRDSRGRRLALVVAAVRLVDLRFRQLEASLEARSQEARAEARRMGESLDRLAVTRAVPEPLDPLKDALTRIEADLVRIERRSSGADVARADPVVTQVREDLASIRRELSASELAEAQRVDELRASVHDAARVLRLLLNRIDPTAPVVDPGPVFTPPRPTDPRRKKP
jgi:hypothetical protein